MDIKKVVQEINKELDCEISCEYYQKIDEWRQWWSGYVKSFHTFKETTEKGKKRERKLYSLKMAKKVCEDWASFLMNEKTEIEIDDEPSRKFVLGEENEFGIGGVFENIRFWKEANRLVEKSFYSGTGAFVIKLDDIPIDEEGNVLQASDGRIRMEYLPASCIVPITLEYGQITECAFVSESTIKGKKYIYIELHLLEGGLYTIRNRYYTDEKSSMKKVELPLGVVEEFNTNSPYPFFAIIQPNTVNPIENNNGLGCSIYSEAIDNLKGVDIAYNNFNRDLWLGGKKVFYNRELTKVVANDENGNPIYLTPDDMLQQLFVSVGDENIDDKSLVHEFNHDLRVEDNQKAVQSQLDYLSFKCGMGTRVYEFEGKRSGNITATQYVGEKQELKQNASKHGMIIEEALIRIVRSILWIGKNIMGEPVNPECSISINFPDGYIVSDEERRNQDILDIREGLMQPYEYRMKWYGETEDEAKTVLELTGFGENPKNPFGLGDE